MTAPRRLVVASRNPHKVRELSALLRPHELEPLPDDVELPPEAGTTFAANALTKARTAAVATGRPSVADDSGIEAAALGGAPGVWSARFAGEAAGDDENLRKLLRDVPEEGDRRVAYVCALAYAEPGGRELVVHGRCEGELALEPRGTGGFGYDPAFVPAGQADERTMADGAQQEIDAGSRRGRGGGVLVGGLVERAEPTRRRGRLGPLRRRGASREGSR